MKRFIFAGLLLLPMQAFAACADYNMKMLEQGLAMSKASNNPMSIQYSQSIMDRAMQECYGGTETYYQYKMLQSQEQQLAEQRRASGQPQPQKRLSCTSYRMGEFLNTDCD